MSDENFLHEGNVRSFPPSLERRLVSAIRWYEERAELESFIGRSSKALNNSEDRERELRGESDRQGGALLLEIMEEMIDAWGIAAVIPESGRKMV